ncbi:hypothetical protein [Pontibacter mucosus]|uniref:hypothetical protein n=1 Tax=Pontibacter mucosus TaxID=1649266 RepID=UPI000D3528CA|nr:hypothetical protein [Pontibacter mucosus]
MKKFTFIFLLSFYSLISFAQQSQKEIELLSLINNSDSTLFREEYEIDLKRRKIYYITPIANYLHVKNAKYRTPVKIDKLSWIKITELINRIDFSKLDTACSDLNKPIYGVEVLNSENATINYVVREKDDLNNLKSIFSIIRKK